MFKLMLLKIFQISIFLLGLFFIFNSTIAQTVSAPMESPSKLSNAVPVGSEISGGTVSLMSNREFWLSVVILIFGVFIILVEYFLLKTVVKDKTEEIARIYTVTLIIIGTLVLISSGFTNEQIAPALGLFGTIAGYLLGRSDIKSQKAESEKKNDATPP